MNDHMKFYLRLINRNQKCYFTNHIIKYWMCARSEKIKAILYKIIKKPGKVNQFSNRYFKINNIFLRTKHVSCNVIVMNTNSLIIIAFR